MTQPTTAALLREAAKLIRARAGNCSPWPWIIEVDVPSGRAELFDANHERMYSTRDDADLRAADAEHIRMWHPGVALAVADWLEAVEENFVQEQRDWVETSTERAALALAQLVLGESEQ